jgi:arylsulfatase A-like enzyme
MAATGPDFKAGFKDAAPVSNADIAPTLAHLLGIQLAGPGQLRGRVDGEALRDGKDVTAKRGERRSGPAANGFTTVIEEQEVDGVSYFDAGGAPGRTVGITGP